MSSTTLQEPAGTPGQHASSRTRRLLHGAVSGFLSKGTVLLANAITIPITIRYLGAETFGVWITISTILSMLLVLDLGVANSLTNFTSHAYATNDRDHASTYSTTALAVMLLLATLLALVAWLLWPHLNWQSIFHLVPAWLAGRRRKPSAPWESRNVPRPWSGRRSHAERLRRLATYSRKSKLYFAFRELGHAVRTGFLLDFLSDVELRCLIQAATNKSERFNQFLQWVAFGGGALAAEGIRDEQRKFIK